MTKNCGKSTLASLAVALTYLPYASLVPFIPIYLSLFNFGFCGYLFLAAMHLGQALSRLLTTRLVIKYGARICMTLGAMF